MGRAGRPKNEMPPGLGELEEHGVPEGWHGFWHGPKDKVAGEDEPHETSDTGWRDEFTAAFKHHNGPDSEPLPEHLEEAAPFYEMPLQKQLEWIRDLVDEGLVESGDREIFGIGDSGAVYGEVHVVDEDGDGRPIRPEKYVSVYREVWEPTGETGDDGTPRFERKEDDLLAEADEDRSISEEDSLEIRKALLAEADWISIPKKS